MWRFTRNNGITEGFQRKVKLIQRRAYGSRNFNNYRLRVIAQYSKLITAIKIRLSPNFGVDPEVGLWFNRKNSL